MPTLKHHRFITRDVRQPLYQSSRVSTLRKDGKTESLSKEAEAIKKNQKEILELKNTINEIQTH